MSIATATRRRRLGALGVVAAAAIGAASLMPAASAAPVDLAAPITGTLNVAGNEGQIPVGTSFTGTWDDELFTFEGELDFPPSSTTADSGLPGIGEVDVSLQISPLTPVTGSWDPDTGDAEAEVSLQLQITNVHIPALATDVDPGPDCIFAPIELSLVGTATTDDDGITELELTHDGFTIPATAAGNCGDLTATFNDNLSGSDNSVTIFLSTDPDQEIPTPPTTTTTVPAETTTTVPADPPAAPAPAAPAAPVSGSANYTG